MLSAGENPPSQRLMKFDQTLLDRGCHCQLVTQYKKPFKIFFRLELCSDIVLKIQY